MSIVLAPSRAATRPAREPWAQGGAQGRAQGRAQPWAQPWAQRRAQRRRLKRQDVLSARLAELRSISELLDQAVAVVTRGWVQDGWFAVDTANGTRVVTAHDLRMAETHPVTGACLVGAVVHAAGGPTSVGTQLVQRTLDLTWHTLREDPARPVRWCPGPGARTVQVLDLTQWNDAPARTRDDVVALLLAAQHTAAAQRDQCVAERASTAAPELTHQ